MNHIDYSIYNNLELLPLDLQGWNGNHHIFSDLIKELKPKQIVEVGSWKGQSSVTMAEVVKRENLDTKILCIDTWLGALEFWLTENLNQHDQNERNLLLKNGYPQIYYQFLSNIVHTNNQNIILPLPLTSALAAKVLLARNIKAELVYIDASHEEDDVYNDIVAYWKILSNDGIMFGDDFHTFWPGVQNAVKKFSKQNSIEYEQVDNFWLMRKKESDA